MSASLLLKLLILRLFTLLYFMNSCVGESLFFEMYALVVFEMRDLEELGLQSLTHILHGSVNLSKNMRLCYISSIDWSQITRDQETLSKNQFKVWIFFLLILIIF